MTSKYRSWIKIVSAASIPFTAWLIYSEMNSPGFCPPYPVLGVPTCYLVFGFFALVFVSQFVRQKTISSFLFQIGAIPGLATAIWFSVHQVLGKDQCPVLLSIPLCFVALATFLVLIILNQVRCIDENACDTTPGS